MMTRSLRVLSVVAVLALAASAAAAGETTELRVAKQYGLGYLQMMVMEDMKLVEKHAKAAGLGDVKVNWSTFRSSDVMNDALLSGNLDFASLGTNGLATIWAKTKGTSVEVRGAAGFNFLPLGLVTREANVKTVADYTEKNKIAVPAVRVSNQAILLQMAAAKQFGQANYTKLDALTVSMTHPDAMAALLSGAGEVGSHFASSPFLQKELERPGIRQIVSSTEILGGHINFNILATTTKFHNANPKAYAAYLAAMQEATEIINKDKRAAAELYIRMTKDKSSADEILKIMNASGEYNFNQRPEGDMRMIQFMHTIGSIKVKPESWNDLLFPMPGK
jgi:NitT/TauT family transport system substrate-binding protein